MRPVSMLGQKNCGTKDRKIKIVNINSKIARTPKLEIVKKKTLLKSNNMNSK